MGKLFVVGLGPGKREYMTKEAVDALIRSNLIIGYTTYIRIVEEIFSGEELLGKEILATGMKQETERCHTALERASEEDALVSMVCSGDSGVYGMAALVLELAKDYPKAEIFVVAGVTAALSGSGVLGAPLGHDFAVISLSDLLTPWEVIENRLAMAAKADMVICLYNPSSKGRADYLKKACDIVRKYKSDETVCGAVRNIGREGESYEIMSLDELSTYEADMFTTVFIGNRDTKELEQCGRKRMYTPRGYGKKYFPAKKKTIILFGGTKEGHELSVLLAKAENVRGIVCVATDYGKEVLTDVPEGCEIRVGRLDEEQMIEFIRKEKASYVIDATHPHAAEVTKNIRKSCEALTVPYLRVNRMKDNASGTGIDYKDIFYVKSAKEAVSLLEDMPGTVYLTCGSKELPDFANLADHARRCFVRVLPSAQVMQICKDLKYLPSQICGMQGPFSYEMNLAMFRESKADILVTKDSGNAGGYGEKLRAAAELGMKIVVILKDTEDAQIADDAGMSVEEAMHFLKGMMKEYE